MQDTKRRTVIKSIGGTTALAGLAGCTNDGEGNGGNGNGGNSSAQDILWLSSTESTGAYQATSGLASVLNQKQNDYQINAPPGGAGPQGMVRMANGEADFAYTNTAVAYQQDNQQGDWEEFPDTDLQQVFHFYDIHFNIASKKSSDIESAEDLEGKRVSLGTTDGTGMQIMPPVLDKGIDVDQVEFAPMSFDQLATALESDRVDAALAILLNTTFPSYTEQVFAQNDARYLDWPEDIRQGVDEDPTYNGRYYAPSDLDGVDNGFDGREQVWFQDSVFHIYTRADQDEQVVYDMLSLLWEHREEIAEYHALNEPWMEKDFLTQKMNEDIGVHPGAKQFFDEIDADLQYL